MLFGGLDLVPTSSGGVGSHMRVLVDWIDGAVAVAMAKGTVEIGIDDLFLLSILCW